MDNSLDEGDTEASIELTRTSPADDKAAYVVIVAPGIRPDDRIQKHLVESLKKEGISPKIINDSKMSEAQRLLGIEIKTTKIENFIVVVIANGFYHDDGEAIIFEDKHVLLDTFIHPFVAFPEHERLCKTLKTAFN